MCIHATLSNNMRLLHSIVLSFFTFYSLLFSIPSLLGAESFIIQTFVLSADTQNQTLTIDNRLNIPHLPAGESIVHVHPGDALNGYVGKIIHGHWVQSNGLSFLERIWIEDPITERIARDINTQLRRDTVTRGRKAFRATGEFLPQCALFNQDGDLMIIPDSFKGKYVVMNFIFTRCAQPQMCPASTARMARLQQELRANHLDNVHQISITFDPEYDTPGILKYYASTRDIDTHTYSFLTGNPNAIEDLMTQFGIIIVPEEGTLDHTMATLIIDPRGKILYRKDGSRWGIQEFIDRIRSFQEKEQTSADASPSNFDDSKVEDPFSLQKP